LCNLFSGGVFDPVNGTKRVQQRFAAGGADARDHVQARGQALLRSAFAVSGDGEAVGFVADTLHQVQSLGVALEEDRVVPAGDEQFLLAFSQPGHGDRVEQVVGLQHGGRPAELTLAAVDQQQVRQDGEGWVGGLADFSRPLGRLPAAEAAVEDLLHAGEVILAEDGFDVEAPIQLLGRRALLEDDHAAHAGHPLGGGDVVALDPAGGFGQVEGFLDLGQCDRLAVLVGLPAGAQCGEGLDRVLSGHLDQLTVEVLVGDGDLDRFPRFTAVEPLADDVGFSQLFWQEHLVGHKGGLGVELLDELGQHLAVVFLLGALEDKVLAADQFAGADEKHLHAGFAVGTRHGDHIGVGLIAADDLLALDHPVDGIQLVADGGGLLVLQVLGGVGHGLGQALDDRPGAPLEELAQVVDHLAVVGLVDGADAGRAAQFDVVVQARAGIFTGDVAVAGQVGEDLAQQVEGLVDGPHAGVGAEVARAVRLHLAGDGHLGEGVAPMDLDIGVALVILKAHVVARLVALDQVHLEDQRLQLGGDHDPLDVGDLAHELVGFGMLVGGIVEVRAHPGAQIDRLADVDDPPGFILHQVAAGLIGQGVQDALEVICCVHTGCILAHGENDGRQETEDGVLLRCLESKQSGERRDRSLDVFLAMSAPYPECAVRHLAAGHHHGALRGSNKPDLSLNRKL
jgi:hypothetical protein